MTVPRRLFLLGVVLATALTPSPALAAPPRGDPVVERLAEGLEGGAGSTIGPDGALYVTETDAGRLSRVDPRTGRVTTVVSGLPVRMALAGGAMDVAFLGRTPYVLVTLVGSDIGGSDPVGLYRVDGPDSVTLVADLGAYSVENPPDTTFFVPTGVQFALETYRGGFLVTDGHHNRILRVTRDGDVSEFAAFGNVVPTGLEVRGATVYMSQAGPVPHRAQDGKVLVMRPPRWTPHEVAAGGPLLVDVEFGLAHRLYALAQGEWLGGPEATPASPDTGQLLRATSDGGFEVVAEGLDRPTSVEIVRNTAYVVTLDGEVWTIDGLEGRRSAG
jgi:sugar lactone lactonase YvrE